tara:strand:+ start:2882 stop:3823 length:942 start_codon:yes stop_codon:yes gene_type:complete
MAANRRSHSSGPLEHPPPRPGRQKSNPSTPAEKKHASNVCFSEGDLVTFIFTHRNIGWYLGGAAGVHLGMQVVLKPGTAEEQTITVGFYPKERGRGMINPVEGALLIPDPSVRDSLAGEIPYTQLNAEPIPLSASAASKLNHYTCTDDPGVKINLSIERQTSKEDDAGAGASKTVSFKKMVTSPDFSYKFHNIFGPTCPGATNCQGFITRIFREDRAILDVIVPFLHTRGSPEVAEYERRMQAQLSKERYDDKFGRYSDGTLRTPASMGIVAGFLPRMGGKKKRRKRKTRRRKRKQKRRRKTRRRRKSRKRRS